MPTYKKIPITEHDPEQEAKDIFPELDKIMNGLSYDAVEIILEQMIAFMYVSNPQLKPIKELLGHYDEWVQTIRQVIIRELEKTNTPLTKN